MEIGEGSGYWAVEKVLAKRIRKGRIEYYLKWDKWSDEFNSWEKQEDVECKDLIAEFEAGEAKKSKAAISKKSQEPKPQKEIDIDSQNSDSANAPKVIEPSGFDRGYIAEKILGINRDLSGQLQFAIKWKEVTKPELVLAKEANEVIPQMVIKFYEKNLVWVGKIN